MTDILATTKASAGDTDELGESGSKIKWGRRGQ